MTSLRPSRSLRFASFVWLILATWATSGRSTDAQNRFEDEGPIELSAEVFLDEVENSARAELRRAEEFLANKQWDDAVETVRRVMADSGERVIRVAAPAGKFAHYIPLREYCTRWLASLARRAPPALALYRSRVDPLAAKWLADARQTHDEALLQRLVDDFMISSWGDEALMLLGEFALERGQYATARHCWERISPQLRLPFAAESWRVTGSGSLWWSVRSRALLDKHWEDIQPRLKPTGRPLPALNPPAARDAADLEAQTAPGGSWPSSYPDTNLSLVEVRARLALVSIMEGDLERAQLEREILFRLSPDAKGDLAGKQGLYATVLSELISDSRSWPKAANRSGWRTFAGSYRRHHNLPSQVNFPIGDIWRHSLPPVNGKNDVIGYGRPRVAETRQRLFSYHPVIWNELLLVNEHDRLRAFRISDGLAAWPQGVRNRQPVGTFFSTQTAPDDLQPKQRHVGVMRGTLSIDGDRLFAKMGSAITTPRRNDRPEKRMGVIVGVDLRAQGRLLPGFPLQPDSAEWFFEGTPVVAQSRLYVAMRRRDEVRTQVHVACYDIDRSRLLWRRLIAAAETPGLGRWPELTHRLLTLSEGSLYFNSGLGSIAALDAADGRIRWILRYPRAKLIAGDPSQTAVTFYRDLTPCLAVGDIIIAAPPDSHRILAIEGRTGQLLWATPASSMRDAVHLLGVVHGQLILSGDFLYRVDISTGRKIGQFPSGNHQTGHGLPEQRGMGRGMIAGDEVYFPTRERVFVLKLPATAEQPWRLSRQLDWAPRKVNGGNIISNGRQVIVAASQEIIAFDNQAADNQAAEHEAAGNKAVGTEKGMPANARRR